MIRKYPSLFLLVFVLLGIVSADVFDLPSWLYLFVSLTSGIVGYYLYAHRRTVATLILLGSCLAGFSAFHYSHRYVDVGPRHVSRVVTEKRIYRIFGKVADWPELKPDRTEIKIALDSLAGETVQLVDGAILLKVTDTTTALQRGDRVEFRGRIYPLPPPGESVGFDYRRYLTLKGISGIVYLPTLLDVRVDRRSRLGVLSFVDGLRAEIVASLKRNLTPVAAALSAGFLIGETRNIPPNVYRMFRDSGTMHLLAVSGSNVALVVLFFVVLMRPLSISPNRRAIVLISVVLVFLILSYGEPSVIRASLMAVLVILSRVAQRRHDLNNIISLTALIILLVAPAQLYDVGFQLSFVTAWGLIFVVPRISQSLERYHGTNWQRWFYMPLIISVVAQIFSMPLIVFYFGRIPVISVLANLLIVPLVSITVVGVLTLLVADLIWPLLGMFVGSLINKLLLLIVALLNLMGGEAIPVLEVHKTLPGGAAVLITLFVYVLIVLFTLSISSRAARRLSILLLVVAINAGLLAGVVCPIDSGVRLVSLYQVPGGVAAFIGRSGSDEADIVLTGLSGRKYPVDEKIVKPMMNRLGIRKIGRLFVVSAEYDALDDIARLIRTYGASAVYVDETLASSFQDVLSADSCAHIPADIIYHQSVNVERDSDGYYSGHQGLWLVCHEHRLLFTDQLSADHYSLSPADCSPILIIGENWRPVATDWITLRESGYQLVVCSRIDHYLTDTGDKSDQNPDRVKPEFLFDLNSLGRLQLELHPHDQMRIRQVSGTKPH